MADISSPGGKVIELGSGRTAETGILESTLSPKYLHTNSTSHTWPFSAIAELIDNAYDPDVKATQFWIDKLHLRGKTCLTFTDNGFGMTAQKLHKMLSFGFCEKVAEKGHMPVGHYGNGFKSGSMRLGKDALVLTKKENSKSIGYLSQTYLVTIKAETVVVPIATWNKKENDFIEQPDGAKALEDIKKYSLLRSEEEIGDEFDKIPGHQGTRIIISNIRKATDNRHEFDFGTDEHDIRIPDDASDGGKYRQTKRQNHIPECDYSLKAYCAILYLKPRMQIILRGKKVKTQNVEKSLSQTEVDRYKPQVLADPVKVVFGFNSLNKNHYGIMMYHRNRLIKPYERVGYQLKANNFGVGVVGIVQCDFLQPTHNKQDFDYTKAYRACMCSLGVKLNEYWNEKKGGTSRMTNSLPITQEIPEPQQQLPDHTWVQCDEPTCLKWRKLPDSVDPKSLPEKWYCHMNPDANYKSCDVPEEKDDDTTVITPYAKVQRKRLERELQEKNKREKETKKRQEIEQKQKELQLKEKEVALKKKEDELKKQYAELQDTKPKVKIEVPTAQVHPRPTTASRPLNAVTPTTNQAPIRQVQSSQSNRSPGKTNQSTPQKLTQSTPQKLTQSTPQKLTQSTPQKLTQSPSRTPAKIRPSPLNQATPRPIVAKPATPSFKAQVKPATAIPIKTSPSSPPSIKIVAKPYPVNLDSGQLVKTHGVNQVTATATNVKPSVLPASNTSNVDIKPKLSVVLPSHTTSSTAKIISSAANDRLCIITPVKTTNNNNAVTQVAQLNAATLPKIVQAVSTAVAQQASTDNKRLITGIKREHTNPGQGASPSKVAKKIDTVIVIDPLQPEKDSKSREHPDTKMARLEQSRVKSLELQLKFKTTDLDRKTKQLESKTKELNDKTKEVDEKTKQLKELRANVCKLLQVLVPEIDVDCEEGKGEGGTIDELLKQVLEANQ